MIRLDFASIVKLSRNARNEAKPATSMRWSIRPSDAISEFDLANMVEDVVNVALAGYTYRKGNKSSSRNFDAVVNDSQNPKDLPTVLVFVDKSANRPIKSESGAWKRILLNLLGNALKYTPSTGHVEIQINAQDVIRQDPLESETLLVTMSVKDTGQGISKSYLQRHLYTPFAQENVLSEGTGLGLSIVKQICDSLGGTVSIDSTVGVGTEIVIRARVEAASNSVPEEILTPDEAKACKALRVAMLDLSTSRASASVHDDATNPSRGQAFYFARRLEDSFRSNLKQWFGIDVIREETFDSSSADLFIVKDCQLEQIQDGIDPGAALFVLEAAPLPVLEHKSKEPCWTHDLPVSAGPRRLGYALSLFLNRRNSQLTRSVNGVPTFAPDAIKILDDEIASLSRNMSASLVTRQDQSRQVDNVQPCIAASSLPKSEHIKDNQSASSKSKRPYVLAVDDNPINLNLLVMFLKKMGTDYATATNGVEAVEAYTSTSRPFDFVLMDVSMPLKDGFAATRDIRSYEHESGTRPAVIAALTGLGAADAHKEARASGMDFFLSKPVSMKQVQALVMKE